MIGGSVVRPSTSGVPDHILGSVVNAAVCLSWGAFADKCADLSVRMSPALSVVYI
jgi:hypothetical protein